MTTVAATTPYAWPYDGRFDPARAALLLVGSVEAPGAVAQAVGVAGALRAAGGVVLHVTTTPPPGRGRPVTTPPPAIEDQVADHHLHAARPEQLLATREGSVLADDHARDLVQQDRAGAHVARRQGGDHGRPPVDRCRLAAGNLQRIGFAMADGAAQLDPSVVPGAKNLAEIVELQSAFIRHQFDVFANQASEIRALTTKIAADTAEPTWIPVV